MRSIVFLLMFGLCPGAAEAFVDAGHLVMNGSTPHGSVCDDDEPAGQPHSHDEHQCSALFHLCGCHAPPPTTATMRVVLSPTQWSELSTREPRPISALVKPADGTASRANRPPIA